MKPLHKALDLSIDQIQVGDSASLSKTFTSEDLATFAELTGDANPLHMDESYAKETKFGQRLVHGMLVSSLISTLVGMHLPGKKCLYLGQTLTFKRPVFVGDTVTVKGKVETKSVATRILTMSISITKDAGEEVIVGVATVQVL